MKIDCLCDCFIGLPGKWKVLLNRFEVAQFAVGNIPVKLVAFEMENIEKYEIVVLYNVKKHTNDKTCTPLCNVFGLEEKPFI